MKPVKLKYACTNKSINMDIISFPVLISKEGKWFVASCPLLSIATQERTEEEVNMDKERKKLEAEKDDSKEKDLEKKQKRAERSFTSPAE